MNKKILGIGIGILVLGIMIFFTSMPSFSTNYKMGIIDGSDALISVVFAVFLFFVGIAISIIGAVKKRK